jgi:predicted SAM-dependent methyltransferase
MQTVGGFAMKNLVKGALDHVGLLDAVRRTKWNIKRGFGRTDRALIESHLASSPVRKLQLGCGSNKLRGWLNSDLFPSGGDVLHLDATSVFPFPSNTFDFVFSEHMIEHIPYTAGQMMLEECYRVLKPGGTIRISTPDLNFVVGLYEDEKSDLQEAYIKWSIDNFVKWAPAASGSYVVNNFVRDWGHQFIYDEKSLSLSLSSARFSNIKRCSLNISDHDALSGLENETRMPLGFLKLETITMEATKPS